MTHDAVTSAAHKNLISKKKANHVNFSKNPFEKMNKFKVQRATSTAAAGV